MVDVHHCRPSPHLPSTVQIALRAGDMNTLSHHLATDDVEVLKAAFLTLTLRNTGSVAIDNKIGKALDLVKSHLLYAVREEVQEMRAQIDELVERNRQLDRENAVLRSCASPETLEFLRQQLPSPSPPDTPSRPLQRQSSYPVQQQLQQLVCNAYPVLTP